MMTSCNSHSAGRAWLGASAAKDMRMILLERVVGLFVGPVVGWKRLLQDKEKAAPNRC